jgi:DNA replication protein DnaC
MVSDRMDFQGLVEAWRAREEKRRAQDPDAYDASLAQYEHDKRQDELEERRFRRSARLERSGVLTELSDDVRVHILADQLGVHEAVEATRKWMSDRARKPWLVLSGKTGTGKTVAAADALAEEGGVFVSAEEVVVAFASMFGVESEKRERMLRSRLLVLDDVGTEKDKDRMLDALVALLSRRASATLTPTILTLNLNAKSFRERYENERLLSRFSQSVHWVALQTKEDMRRRK